MNIQKELFALQDLKYRDFHATLMPTVSKDVIIGVRTPALRKLAKSLKGTPAAEEFLRTLPHAYYEENNLHAFLVAEIREYDRALSETERFLPYIDNWATCDMFFPKVFLKNADTLLPKIRDWLASEKEYTVRYAIGLLMRLFLDEAFSMEYPAMVAAVRREDYYIKMMVAWYFATALAKQYEVVLPFLTENRLDTWTHNKTIQKSVESLRIPKETKTYLKTLKR